MEDFLYDVTLYLIDVIRKDFNEKLKTKLLPRTQNFCFANFIKKYFLIKRFMTELLIIHPKMLCLRRIKRRLAVLVSDQIKVEWERREKHKASCMFE